MSKSLVCIQITDGSSKKNKLIATQILSQTVNVDKTTPITLPCSVLRELAINSLTWMRAMEVGMWVEKTLDLNDLFSSDLYDLIETEPPAEEVI